MKKRQALIDIGSNTVKLAVYELEGAQFSCIHYESRYGYLIREVRDGVFSPAGIRRLGELLTELKKAAAGYGCQPGDGSLRCFSTASLRGAENIQNVITDIKNTTEIEIDPISGETEARCNLRALRETAGLASFFGADLGGGSIQLFRWQEGRLNGTESLPAGSLKLARDFVADVLPTRAEAERIRRYVRGCLEAGSVRPAPGGPEALLAMGGTLRLISGLLGSRAFPADALSGLLERYLDAPEQARQEICGITPERLNSVVPGMLCLETVCRYFSLSRLQFMECSVREGYLLEYIINDAGESQVQRM